VVHLGFGAHQDQQDKQQQERARHPEQRKEDGGIDGGPVQPPDRGCLVQGVPPIERELDDRQVDDAYQRQDRGCTIAALGAALLVWRHPLAALMAPAARRALAECGLGRRR